jgi:hypothetical protein
LRMMSPMYHKIMFGYTKKGASIALLLHFAKVLGRHLA